MASKRMIRREISRTTQQRFEKREAIRKKLKDPSLDLDEKFALIAQMEKMPRDSSHVRRTNRCQITGRARGTYRKFELCRNKIRELAMRGEIPGLVMASW
jgi:small subunit ribosomal protein S14